MCRACSQHLFEPVPRLKKWLISSLLETSNLPPKLRRLGGWKNFIKNASFRALHDVMDRGAWLSNQCKALPPKDHLKALSSTYSSVSSSVEMVSQRSLNCLTCSIGHSFGLPWNCALLMSEIVGSLVRNTRASLTELRSSFTRMSLIRIKDFLGSQRKSKD